METLNDIIEESARKFGGKDAFMIRPGFRTRAWSYRDLNDIVPRVARYLSDSGMKQGDRVLFTATKGQVVRQHISHLSHHRGQMTVYLRLLDVPVPSIYGPTADDQRFL